MLVVEKRDLPALDNVLRKLGGFLEAGQVSRRSQSNHHHVLPALNWFWYDENGEYVEDGSPSVYHHRHYLSRWSPIRCCCCHRSPTKVEEVPLGSYCQTEMSIVLTDSDGISSALFLLTTSRKKREILWEDSLESMVMFINEWDEEHNPTKWTKKNWWL